MPGMCWLAVGWAVGGWLGCTLLAAGRRTGLIGRTGRTGSYSYVQR
jgi:hypothetical protein